MIGKTIKVDLRACETTGVTAGYIGEINHRKLEVYPPDDLKSADYFMIAFEINGETCRTPVTMIGNTRVQVSLAPPVTSQSLVGMTLEGYREDRTILGKSRMISLRFLPSASGEPGDFTGPPGPPGVGVPPGGEDGQVLTKASAEDYDTHWTDHEICPVLEIPYETTAMLLAGNEPPGEAEDGEMTYAEAMSILTGNETPGEAEDDEIPYWLAKQILHGGAE